MADRKFRSIHKKPSYGSHYTNTTHTLHSTSRLYAMCT